MVDRLESLQEINLLDLRPQRLAAWEELDGDVVIARPAPPVPWFRSIGRWVSFAMSTRRIRLDERGGFIWKCLDGNRTVADVVAEARARFGEDVEPAEERVGLLVRHLRQEELVAYPGWDATPEGDGAA